LSLILEALRKLEREKAAGDRGFVVLSQVPWVSGRAGRAWLGWVALVAVLAGVGLIVGWIRWSTLPAKPLSAAAGPPVSSSPTAAIAAAGSPISSPEPTRLGAPPASASAASPTAPLPAPRIDTRPLPQGVVAPSPRPVAPAGLPTTQDASESPVAADSAVAPPPKKGELRLNAISVRDGLPIAIVNDRLVREGDSFDGIHVLRIGEAEVEIEVGGQRKTLRF
jgi:hypothetical protein